MGVLSIQNIIRSETEAMHILEWQIESRLAPVDGDVLPEIHQLQSRTQCIGRCSCPAVQPSEQRKHDASDGICRTTAIIEELIEGFVLLLLRIAHEGVEQVVKQLFRNTEAMNGIAESQKNGMPRSATRCLSGRCMTGGTQLLPPVLECLATLRSGGRTFIGDIIGMPGKSVDRCDMWTQMSRQEQRGDWKIFVMRTRQTQAIPVCLPQFGGD